MSHYWDMHSEQDRKNSLRLAHKEKPLQEKIHINDDICLFVHTPTMTKTNEYVYEADISLSDVIF